MSREIKTTIFPLLFLSITTTNPVCLSKRKQKQNNKQNKQKQKQKQKQLSHKIGETKRSFVRLSFPQNLGKGEKGEKDYWMRD